MADQGKVDGRVLLSEVRQRAAPVTGVPAQVLPAVLRSILTISCESRQATHANGGQPVSVSKALTTHLPCDDWRAA